MSANRTRPTDILFSLCRFSLRWGQLSYPEALKQVVDEDGVTGLFIRGLQTRILVNALQVSATLANPYYPYDTKAFASAVVALPLMFNVTRCRRVNYL